MLARARTSYNSRLRGDLLQPLRIGIGIHFGEAIVGAMGPPGSQIVSAIGETADAVRPVWRASTKRDQCRVGRVAAGGRNGAGLARRKSLSCNSASVNGLAQPVEFYALNSMADLRV